MPAPTAIATYRVQLEPRFDFAAATAQLDYLAALGVSHLYTSPVAAARPGSTHGYDVIDPTRPNPALGGADGFSRLLASAREHSLGVMIDIVPNHMAVSSDNPWWWDVLECGLASRYASFFDIQWGEPDESGAPTTPLVLPLLPDRYWRVLTAGGIAVVRDEAGVRIRSGETLLPTAPESLASLWREAAHATDAGALRELVSGCSDDTSSSGADWRAIAAQATAICHDDAGAAAAVDAVIAATNASPARLDAFLERQHYRLAFWKSAQTELAYRRFFDVDTLIGLRVEDPEVFEAVHRALLGWIESGDLDGLRVDHIDGLRDPAAYLERLRAAAPQAWIVVEKILSPGEPLPPWPIEGTTGYEFLSRVGGLFIDPAGIEGLDRVCTGFLGSECDFPAAVRAAKLEVLRSSLAADVQRLTSALRTICARHRRVRDFAHAELDDALCELVAAFPVYRTYVRDGTRHSVAPEDRSAVRTALARVRAARPDIDELLLDFLGALACLDLGGALEADFALRLQQLTGPAMAKGVEDTAYYRVFRLASLNEVGDDPASHGVTVEAFHAANRQTLEQWPQTLLATATHDTKRGEDVRARLALLSEMPAAWEAALSRWSARNATHRGREDVGREMELLFYQTLVGAWPIDADRLVEYLRKAAREGKQRTTWVAPNEAYETALEAFARAVRDDAAFVTDLERFVAPLIPLGRVNGLAQVLLKLTAPGIPDLYQGSELWDLNLVDPDNRRPVDYALRRRLLGALDDATPEEIMRRADDGLPKLWTIRQALSLRHRRPGCFGPEGSYEPLLAEGPRAAHCVAFARGGRVATIAPRLVLRLRNDWRDTTLALPFDAWRNVLTGERGRGARVALREVLRRFPVALLEREP